MEEIYDALLSEADSLTDNTKMRIIHIVAEYDETKLKQGTDGIRIVLNKLPDNIVKKMYSIINE